MITIMIKSEWVRQKIWNRFHDPLHAKELHDDFSCFPANNKQENSYCCLKTWESWILHNTKAFKPVGESVNPVLTCHQADGQAIFFTALSAGTILDRNITELESHHLLLRKLQTVIAGHWVWQPHTPRCDSIAPLEQIVRESFTPLLCGHLSEQLGSNSCFCSQSSARDVK